MPTTLHLYFCVKRVKKGDVLQVTWCSYSLFCTSKLELLHRGLEPITELGGDINSHYMENHSGCNL